MIRIVLLFALQLALSNAQSERRSFHGLVYFSSGHVMIAMMVLSFPPKPNREGNFNVYRDACEQLLKWAKPEYLKIPQRFTPVVCMDLNSGPCPEVDSEAAGPHGAENENACGAAVHEWLDSVGPASNRASQIDYARIPAGARPLVRRAKTWERSAQEDRSMPAVLDHTPVVLKIKIMPPLVLTPRKERRVRAKLSKAALTGVGREAFLSEIQEL
ncbi:unnamed protein product [Prorocentrum cordatum]|uniref:Nocturnin n=1 Tax=Prorocentrum cordatum TaxID=2364126 RepID=A0ABN9QF71_9DINO|nr:unnamed protein product [Polarella glacialis]